MQGHYIIHEYQLILASPLLAIGVTCLYSLLDDILLATQDSWPRENLADADQSCLALRVAFSGHFRGSHHRSW